jgi:CHAT domain-containing protein/tetratricopeptide (TPR) repeat protein
MNKKTLHRLLLSVSIILTTLTLYAAGDGTGLEKGITSLRKSDYQGCMRSLESYLDSCRERNDRSGEAAARLWLARAFQELALYDRSIDLAGESRNIYESLKDARGMLDANLALAEGLLSLKKGKEARELVEESEKMIGSDTPDGSRIDFYIMRGLLLRRKKEYDLSRKNFDAALEMSSKLKDTFREVRALCEIALLNARKEEFDKAHEACSRALEAAMESDRPYAQGLAQKTAGLIGQHEARYEEALNSSMSAIATYRASGNHSREGEMYLEAAYACRMLNDTGKSRKYLDKAIAVYRDSGDVRGWLEACRQYHYLLYDTREASDVEKVRRQMSEAGKSSQDPRFQALAWRYIGKLLMFVKGDYSEATGYFEQAAQMYGRINDLKGEVDCLRDLTWCLGEIGKFDLAHETAERALKKRMALGEVRSYDDFDFYYYSSVGRIYTLMGNIYLMQARFHEAIEKFEKALEIDKAEERIIDRVFDYYYLLQSAMAIYDIDLAWQALCGAFRDIPREERVVSMATSYNLIISVLIQEVSREKPEDEGEESSTLQDSLALMLIEKIRRDPELYRQIKEACRAWVEDGEKKKDLHWTISGHMASGRFSMLAGELDDARSQFESAIDLARKMEAGNLEGLAYHCLIELMMSQGKTDEAMRIMEKQVEVYSRRGDVSDLICSLLFLSSLQNRKKKYDDSMHTLDRAMALARAEKDDQLLIYLLKDRGHTLFLLENCGEALVNLQEALERAKSRRMEKVVAVTLAEIASIHVRQGIPDKGLDEYKASFAIFEKLHCIYEMNDLALKYGGLLEKGNQENEALALYLKVLDKIISEWESAPKELGRISLSRKSPAMTLFERAINLLIKSGRYEEALKYLELSRSLEILSGLNLDEMKLQDEKMSHLLDKVRTLRRKMALIQKEMENADSGQRKDSLSRILASNRKDFFAVINEIKRANADFEQLLSVRGTDLAALQRITPDDALLIEYYPSGDALYIFLVSNDSFQIRKVEIGRDRLYKAVRELRGDISGPGGPGASQEMERYSSFLYSMLLEPLEGELRRYENIIIVPGGLLWYLPFEMLAPKGRALLIEEKAVSYLSSGDIVKLLERKKRPSNEEGRLLILGAPEGTDLTHAQEEAKRIASIFTESDVFIGDLATKRVFFEKAPSSSMVHIATHSSLDRDRVNNSFIQLAGPDGKLYLGEIYGLTLQPSSLVALSSCDSALGEDNPGREFASLASAFTTAGASSVIASMWKVDDMATARLFVEFYRNLKGGMPRAESLRLAKLHLRRDPQTSHPFYWSGFVLMGDWR